MSAAPNANETAMKLFAAQMEHRRLKMRASKLDKLLAAMDERVSRLFKEVDNITQTSWGSDATEISTAKDDVVRSELAKKICSEVPGFSRAMDKFQKTWRVYQAVAESLEADMREIDHVWKYAKDEKRKLLKDAFSAEQQAALRVESLQRGESVESLQRGKSVAAPVGARAAATKRRRSSGLTGRSGALKLAKRSPAAAAAELEPAYKLSVLECR
jgi:hypothetical protein